MSLDENARLICSLHFYTERKRGAPIHRLSLFPSTVRTTCPNRARACGLAIPSSAHRQQTNKLGHVERDLRRGMSAQAQVEPGHQGQYWRTGHNLARVHDD